MSHLHAVIQPNPKLGAIGQDVAAPVYIEKSAVMVARFFAVERSISFARRSAASCPVNLLSPRQARLRSGDAQQVPTHGLSWQIGLDAIAKARANDPRGGGGDEGLSSSYLVFEQALVRSRINTGEALNDRTTPMPQVIDQDEHDQIAAVAVERMSRAENREKLIAILPQIAAEVVVALSVADLNIPVFVSVPASGDALLTVGSPHDPVDSDWYWVCAKVCEILEAQTGMRNLVARELPCCSAAMQAVGVAELHAGRRGVSS
jgi:hypothetical protein